MALSELVQAFEKGTLPREAWTHAAHLQVAAWYLINLPFEEATGAIRDGIQRFNAAHGIETTPTGGYHETVTRFWIHIVRHFLQSVEASSSFDDTVGELTARFGTSSRLHREYYSSELFTSTAARYGWVEPDLKPLP